MISVIALIIIAVVICILIITYYRERKNLIYQLLDIDNSLSEMKTNLNKLERINNKIHAVENKVQTSIDKTFSVMNYIENNVTMHLTSIKSSQDVYITKLDSKTNKLQNSVDCLVKENAKRYQDLINIIDRSIINAEHRTNVKLDTIDKRVDAIGENIVAEIIKSQCKCEAKNSFKTSKPKNTTKIDKQENNKLKTAE